MVLAVVWLLASIPFLWWRRALLRFVMRVNPEFPADENPDDDEMYALVFLMKHAYLMKSRPGTYKYQKSEGACIAYMESTVAIVIVIFISWFLFYCLLLNHSFQTSPNSVILKTQIVEI